MMSTSTQNTFDHPVPDEEDLFDEALQKMADVTVLAVIMGEIITPAELHKSIQDTVRHSEYVACLPEVTWILNRQPNPGGTETEAKHIVLRHLLEKLHEPDRFDCLSPDLQAYLNQTNP